MLAQHATCLSARHCMLRQLDYLHNIHAENAYFPLSPQVPGRAGCAAGIGAGAVLAAEQGPGAAGDAASVPGPRHSNHCVFAARPGCASEVPTPAQLRPSLTALLVPGPRHRRHRLLTARPRCMSRGPRSLSQLALKSRCFRFQIRHCTTRRCAVARVRCVLSGRMLSKAMHNVAACSPSGSGHWGNCAARMEAPANP